MNTETLEGYVKRVHPKVLDEYVRVITPFYYEPNVRYNPITSGFGCGSEGSSKELVIIDGTYHKDGDISMTLQDVNSPKHIYSTV